MTNTRLRWWLLGIGLALAVIAVVVFATDGFRDALSRHLPAGRPGAGGHVHQGKTLDEWVQHLDGSNVEELVAACLALQYFTQEQAAVAVPKLMPLLKSKSHNVRGAAAYALGRIGPAARDAIPLITELLADESVHAAEALYRLCGPEDGAAVPALNAALQNAAPDASRDFCLDVARALGNIGPNSAPAVSALTDLLSAKDHYLRSAAAESLGQIGPAAAPAVPALTAALGDGEGAVRVEVAVALWRIERSPKSVPTLLDVFNDRKIAYSRKLAADALGRIGPGAKDAVPALRDAAQNDTTPGVNGRLEVRAAAAAALKKIESE